MQQTSLTFVIKCDPDTLWTVLGDMVKNPQRYEDKVTLKKISPPEAGAFARIVERRGAVLEEIIQFRTEALMVELTVEEPYFALIHQIVPSGSTTVLNLAATWEPLDPEDLSNETTHNRLQALGRKLRTMAEQLAG